MAAEKNITSRIQQKHDTAANWANATTFIPKKGEIVIYDAEYNASGAQTQAVRFKIGDGSRTINNLPFAVIDYNNRITSIENTVDGLGTAAQKDVGFFATAAQGTKADNAVPNTRKVNNKALSTDITLEPSDVGVTESAFPGLKKTGTITGITMNGASKGTSGVVDLGTVITAHQDISGKQDKITSTEKLPVSLVSGLATVATSGSYNDLSNTPTIPDPNNLAKLDAENTFTTKQTINSGYGTVSLKTQGYVELNASWLNGTLGGLLGLKLDDTSGRVYAVTTNDLGLVRAIRINNATKQPGDTGIVDLGTVLTTHQTIKTLKTNNDTAQEVSAGEAISGSGIINLHKVAKTGSYNDLLNTPDLVTESTVSGWGFTKNKGTVTQVKINNVTKSSDADGLVDLGTVITSHQDISGLMPKSGGTFTGNISVPKTITFTDETNPFIKMRTGSTDFYFQSTSGQFGLGPTWNQATHWDSEGNVTFPTVPKVGSTSLALTSQIPSFSLSGTTLTITV